MQKPLTKFEQFRKKAKSLHCPAAQAAGKVVKAIVPMDYDQDGYILIGYTDGTYSQVMATYHHDRGDVCIHRVTTSPAVPYSPDRLRPYIPLGIVTEEEIQEMIDEISIQADAARVASNIAAYRNLYEQFKGVHPDELEQCPT